MSLYNRLFRKKIRKLTGVDTGLYLVKHYFDVNRTLINLFKTRDKVYLCSHTVCVIEN